MQSFGAALRLRPGHIRAYNHLGAALHARGDRGAAVQVYQQAIRLKPNFAGPRFGLATILQEQGNEAAAIQQYRAIIDMGDDEHLQRMAQQILRAMGEKP